MALRAQVPGGFYVCPQVRLADMLTIAGFTPNGFSAALRQVASKSVDFAVINLESGRVVLVIELNDKTHHAAHRRARDRFVARVLDAAQIPLARFRPGQQINVRSYFEAGSIT